MPLSTVMRPVTTLTTYCRHAHLSTTLELCRDDAITQPSSLSCPKTDTKHVTCLLVTNHKDKFWWGR